VVIVGDGKPLSSVGMLSALASSSAGKREERSGGGGSGGASLVAASTAAAAAEGTEADAAAQIAAAGVLATAEPPVASAEDEAAAAAAAAAARPWSSVEEMEVCGRCLCICGRFGLTHFWIWTSRECQLLCVGCMQPDARSACLVPVP
jgi:hypothetical protein